MTNRVTRQNPLATLRDFGDIVSYNDNSDGTATVVIANVEVGTLTGPETPVWSGLVGKPDWVDAFFIADESTTADDITAWLATPYAGWRWLVGAATLDEPFVMPSNTWLDVSGASITLADGSHCRLVENAAATPLRMTSADAVCTAGDNTVTSATGAFTSADVGRVLGVGFVAESTRGANAYGRITAVNSSTSVEIDVPPLESESGGVAYVYGRDTNIAVRGGTWDRGPGGAGTRMAGKGTNMTTLAFYRVDGLELTGMDVIGENPAGRGFGVTVGDCTDFDVDYRVNTSGDGFHIHGPVRDGRVRVAGISDDDLIGITATDYGHLNHTHGDIDDLDLWADGDATDHRLILLATSCRGGAPPATQYPDGHSIRRVTIHRARDTASNSAGISTWVQCDDPDSRIEDLTIKNADCPVNLFHNNHGKVVLENVSGLVTVSSMPSGYPNTASVVDDLTMINCTGGLDTDDTRTTISKFTMRGGSISWLSLACAEIGSLLCERVTFLDRLFWLISNCDVGVLSFIDCDAPDLTYTAGTGVISSGSVVGEIKTRGCNFTSSAATNDNLVDVKSGATLGTLRVSDTTLTGMKDVLINSSSAQVRTFLSNLSHIGGGRMIEGTGGAVVTYNGVYFDNTLEPFYANGPMVLSGSAFSAPNVTNGVTVAGAGSARVMDQNLRAAVQLLTETLGDTAYNTNAGLACGVGPVVSDGTNWKHIYTGAATT